MSCLLWQYEFSSFKESDTKLDLFLTKDAHTLASGIDVGQGMNVGPGKFGKKNKRRALNTHVVCSK